MAAPVPKAMKFTVIHGYLAWKESFKSSLMTVPFLRVSGVSSNPVSYRLVVVAILSVVGLGIGVAVGDGVGEFVGAAVGEGVGLADVTGDGEGEEDGDGDGEGDAVGVAVGEGVGVACGF